MFSNTYFVTFYEKSNRALTIEVFRDEIPLGISSEKDETSATSSMTTRDDPGSAAFSFRSIRKRKSLTVIIFESNILIFRLTSLKKIGLSIS